MGRRPSGRGKSKADGKELPVRGRELEPKRSGGTGQDEGRAAQPACAAADRRPAQRGEGYEVAEGTSNFGALVKDLHGEIDAAHVLKKALEADLVATQEKLSKEQGARAQLEAQIRGLEAKVGLGDQLREDISLVEEEQNRTSRRLKEVTSELKKVTEERNSIAQQKDAAEKRMKELQKERFDLEAQVLSLKERLAELVSWFSGQRPPSS